MRGQSAAAGNRLLISLKVKAHEKKSWFGFGANATVHIWGKPALDPKTRSCASPISLAVESQAAFGLLGAAARAAVPYLQQGLAEKAVVDLKPFAADARTRSPQRWPSSRGRAGVQVDAAVNDLRLTGIAFDANTLRVIAEADGGAKVTVSELPKM